MIGGAAAAATLVVSFGVGALTLPGGDDGAAQPTAVDDSFAASAAPTEEPALDTLAAPSPSTIPTPASPSPSPSKVVKPTPASSRSTAASRRSVERSTAPSNTGSSTGSNGSSGSVSAQAREVVDLVNAERAKAGCKALSIDDKLMTAAQRHSQDQADNQNMSHTGSDGSNAGTRLDRVGYTWRTYGENVAWNQKTPAAVMDAWMNSSGHRANILNCAFTEIGVGIANSNGPYWTQVFAAPR
ncbi:Non-specific serine/threonine protein kinase [Micromonospora noduli]|nr:Non-specific serine/threonine protein kinase [Micromonospora noduli]